MIKIEFPADRADLARAFGAALLSIGGEEKAPKSLAEESTPPPLEAEPTGTAPTAESEPSAPSETNAAAEADSNGVPFNPAFCGRAAEPFYATGKMAGQWKKRKGVDQSEYDAWYARQLSEPEPEQVNASTAFKAPAVEQEPVPADAGELMVWVSNKQQAGVLTQDQFDAAFAAAGIGMQDLFGPNSATAVPAVFAELKKHV